MFVELYSRSKWRRKLNKKNEHKVRIHVDRKRSRRVQTPLCELYVLRCHVQVVEHGDSKIHSVGCVQLLPFELVDILLHCLIAYPCVVEICLEGQSCCPYSFA